MPAIAFSEFDGLPDALATDRFELLLEPTIAPGTNRVLALRCQQVAVPGTVIEQMIVAIHGHEYVFRGRRTYSKQMAAAFVETVDGAVTKAIRTWQEGIVGTESGNGADKKTYATRGTLIIYDQSGNAALTYNIENCWISDLQDVQADGQSSQPFLANVTFTYDRITQNGVAIT